MLLPMKDVEMSQKLGGDQYYAFLMEFTGAYETKKKRSKIAKNPVSMAKLALASLFKS